MARVTAHPLRLRRRLRRRLDRPSAPGRRRARTASGSSRSSPSSRASRSSPSPTTSTPWSIHTVLLIGSGLIATCVALSGTASGIYAAMYIWVVLVAARSFSTYGLGFQLARHPRHLRHRPLDPRHRPQRVRNHDPLAPLRLRPLRHRVHLAPPRFRRPQEGSRAHPHDGRARAAGDAEAIAAEHMSDPAEVRPGRPQRVPKPPHPPVVSPDRAGSSAG